MHFYLNSSFAFVLLPYTSWKAFRWGSADFEEKMSKSKRMPNFAFAFAFCICILHLYFAFVFRFVFNTEFINVGRLTDGHV